MPRLIAQPSVVQAAGHPPKRIEEFAGHVASGAASVSVARMSSPTGRQEPGEWVRYGTPGEGGAEYIAVCLPAFTPATVHRDPETSPARRLAPARHRRHF